MIIAVLHDSWEEVRKKDGVRTKDLLRLKEQCRVEFGQEVYGRGFDRSRLEPSGSVVDSWRQDGSFGNG
jgi:hypothetical protein